MHLSHVSYNYNYRFTVVCLIAPTKLKFPCNWRLKKYEVTERAHSHMVQQLPEAQYQQNQ